MSYNLFIDDERMPPNDHREWIVARTSGEAVSFLYNYGTPSFISFDHDLGGDDTSIVYIDVLIELALDLIDMGVDPGKIKFPRDFVVHSQNPVGAKNIEQKMKHFIHHLDNL